LDVEKHSAGVVALDGSGSDLEFGVNEEIVANQAVAVVARLVREVQKLPPVTI
jgi:hypothetical protein